MKRDKLIQKLGLESPELPWVLFCALYFGGLVWFGFIVTGPQTPVLQKMTLNF